MINDTGAWTLQQDGAPHTPHTEASILCRQNIDFIESDMWPVNSPDIKSVDCASCTSITESVRSKRLSERQQC